MGWTEHPTNKGGGGRHTDKYRHTHTETARHRLATQRDQLSEE